MTLSLSLYNDVMITLKGHNFLFIFGSRGGGGGGGGRVRRSFIYKLGRSVGPRRSLNSTLIKILSFT
jgi:hypothetical protein